VQPGGRLRFRSHAQWVTYRIHSLRVNKKMREAKISPDWMPAKASRDALAEQAKLAADLGAEAVEMWPCVARR
jgi:hypothetical protein